MDVRWKYMPEIWSCCPQGPGTVDPGVTGTAVRKITDLQNLVQLKIINPSRRNSLYRFDRKLLLEGSLHCT
jgi:hypothetical protein